MAALMTNPLSVRLFVMGDGLRATVSMLQRTLQAIDMDVTHIVGGEQSRKRARRASHTGGKLASVSKWLSGDALEALKTLGTGEDGAMSTLASSARGGGQKGFGFAPGSTRSGVQGSDGRQSGGLPPGLLPKPAHLQSWLFQPHTIDASLVARQALDVLGRAVSSSLAAGGMYEGDSHGMQAPHTKRLVLSVSPSHAAIRYVTSADVLALLANYLLVDDAEVVRRIVGLLEQLLSAATSALDATQLAKSIHASGIVPVMLLRVLEWSAPPLDEHGLPDGERRKDLAVQAVGMLRSLVRACADGIDTVAVTFAGGAGSGLEGESTDGGSKREDEDEDGAHGDGAAAAAEFGSYAAYASGTGARTGGFAAGFGAQTVTSGRRQMPTTPAARSLARRRRADYTGVDRNRTITTEGQLQALVEALESHDASLRHKDPNS